MQLSTNSNWHTQHLIRSRPTWAGRYRQAYIQRQDRLWSAEDIERTIQMQEEEIALLRLDLEEMDATPVSGLEAKRMQHRRRLVELEIEKLQAMQERNRMRLRDCYREAEVCEAEMKRIQEESGLDFASMSEEEFQAHMAEEARLSLAKNLAAAELSAKTGMPLMATEAWLDIIGDLESFQSLVQLKNQVVDRGMKVLPTGGKNDS